MRFKEDFLHFIWKFRLYNSPSLYCKSEGKLQIINPGLVNKNAGPDFTEARLRIDDTIWVGNVEIHLKSSDWLLHCHQDDPAYDNVILHVVYENDQRIYRKNGSEIPVLVMKGTFDEQLFLNYKDLITAANNFPCEKHLWEVDRLFVNGFLSKVMVERFEQKAIVIDSILEKNKGDWEKTFYYFLARSFGFKVNAIPFELLAASLDLQIIKKHLDNPLQVEALLFGQAGFLNRVFEEDYPESLRKEYHFLKKKYLLEPIPVSSWKFLRMRPQSFPTIRLAQFCALLLKHPNLFAQQLDLFPFSCFYQLLEQLPVNEYWTLHYHFNRKSRKVSIQIGKSSIESILINTICLFLYVYGKYTDQEKYIEKAFDLLYFLPAEKNSIIEGYRLAGIKMDNAFLSQAVLQLNKSYCSQKKCLNCNIGIKILKK